MIPFLVVFDHQSDKITAGPKDEPNPLHAKLTIPNIVSPDTSEYIAVQYANKPRIIVMYLVFVNLSEFLVLITLFNLKY